MWRVHHRQSDVLEGSQQQCGGGARGDARGIAGVEAGQRTLFLGQARTDGIVKRGEDA